MECSVAVGFVHWTPLAACPPRDIDAKALGAWGDGNEAHTTAGVMSDSTLNGHRMAVWWSLFPRARRWVVVVRIASPQTRRSHPLDADHREPAYVRS